MSPSVARASSPWCATATYRHPAARAKDDSARYRAARAFPSALPRMLRTATSDSANATALLQGVNSSPQSLLVGIAQAQNLVLGDLS